MTKTTGFNLRGSLVPMTIMELAHYDAAEFTASLQSITSQAPAFFKDIPIVIALEKHEGLLAEEQLAAVIQACKKLRVHPVAIRGGDELQQNAARAVGLAALPAQDKRKPQDTAHNQLNTSSITASHSAKSREENIQTLQAGSSETKAESKPAAKIIYQPIRSGQQIYAQGTDLVVLSSVSAGAEILADGNIHVYGPLRGRALAGINGDKTRRIFCQSLEAELVSIAGQYKISEDLQSEGWKAARQIYLDGEKINIVPL